MFYYIVIAFCDSIFCIGLRLLKRTFFSYAKVASYQFNLIIDTTLEEEEKQKLLTKNIGKLLLETARISFFLVAILFVSISPFILYAYCSSVQISDLDLSSFYFYLSMIIGSLVLFMPVPFKKEEKKEYSDWAILLHQIILDNYAISRLLFSIEKRFYYDKEKAGKGKFIVVTGLARAGTTAFTNLLHSANKFNSLSYDNMPFLLSVNLWKTIYNPGKGKLKQRAHGDKVLFGYKTIEALEEYFFKVHSNDVFIKESTLVEYEIDQKTYENYLIYQALINKSKQEGSIYIAKNNNLILRYESLKKYDPSFKTILIFRDPMDHAISLYRQHIRFTDMQTKDGFVLEYMNWLGHHEFGNGHKPFQLTGALRKNTFQTSDINYWLVSWINYYNRFLSFPEDNSVLVVDYSDLVNSPLELLALLGEKLDMDLSQAERVPFKKEEYKPMVADPDVLSMAYSIYERLIQKKQKV